MESTSASWQKHFGLTVCSANTLEQKLPAAARGVAVIYAASSARDQVFLVIESRAGALLTQCQRRLQTARLPARDTLSIAFRAEVLPDTTPEAVHAACRDQVVFAGELRRELRPAMR